MSENDRARRARRIHVEGAGPGWSDNRPVNPLDRQSAAPGVQQGNATPPQPGPALPGNGSPVTDSLRGAAAEHRIAEQRADVHRRLTSIAQRLAVVRAALPTLQESEVAAAETRATAARATAEAARAAAVTEAEADHSAATAHASAQVRRLLEEWAPGAAARDFTPDASGWDDRAAIPAGWTRFGHLGPLAGLPAVAPLVDHRGWYVSAADRRGVDLAFAAALRVVAQAPVRHLAIDVFDPRLTGAFGRFAPLRAANGSTFPIPSSDARAFTERLAAALDDASRNVELVVANGARSLTDLWRRQGLPEGTLRLVVLLGYPAGVDAALHELLVRAASVAGPSGTTLLVVEDPAARPAQDVVPHQLRDTLHSISLSGDAWQSDGFPVPVTPDAAAPDAVVAAVLASAAAAMKSVTGPVIPLHGLIADDLANPWGHDSTESLDAVIGEANRQLLELSLRSENPPHPNVLIGGAVGQGKSNLLLDIVYSLAVRYSPDQLEMYLLDFKRGLSFKALDAGPDGTGWLPHVRVLGLESDREFGVAVLRHVDEEMVRRSHLFKAAGADSINDYRATTGHTLPRILLVIDEFHVLFEGDDLLVEQAVELLDRLAKQGRAYGVHLMLASQTTSGVRGLAIKGDSIFAQFPLRLSLKNTPIESQAILSEGNKAAADLTYRGEVVLNRNYGGDPAGSNIRGVAALAGDQMAAVQRGLWERDHAEPPLVFLGREYARWDAEGFAAHRDAAAAGSPGDGVLSLWVGRPIAVTQEPFALTVEADADQAVAVIGPGAAAATAALRSMTLTACHALAPRGGSLVLLDGADTSGTGWAADVLAYAGALGIETTVVPRDGIAPWLRALAPRLADRGIATPVLVLGAGLQRARDMDVSDADDDPFAEPPTGRDVLRQLATAGPLAGVHLIGWWSTLRAAETDLGLELAGVAHVLTAGLGLVDLRTIGGPTVPPITGDPRLGVYSRMGDGDLVPVVPFAGSTDAEGR